MQTSEQPVLRDIVLVGGGHSHVGVLKSFGMQPIPGVRLTLICTDMHTPYSGMLPGYVAGHYDYDEVHIDLSRLCVFAGARLFKDEVVGIDRVNKKILCRNRPPVPYDQLSINIGSTPQLGGVPGASDYAVAVKPIQRFNDRWLALLDRVKKQPGKTTIAVVGAGAGGVELLLAMQYRLRNELTALNRNPDDLAFHLFTNIATILPTHNAGVRKRFETVLGQRSVVVHHNAAVNQVHAGSLQTANGQTLKADEIIWVTRAGGAPWLQQTGLDLDAEGFIKVQDTLQTVTDPDIFAAGDIASMVNYKLEKAGVFAVRQGKPLTANLRRAVEGTPLQAYRPQTTWLALISTGDKYAVAAVSARLEAANGKILLGDRIGKSVRCPRTDPDPVERVDLAAQHGAFQRPAGLALFILIKSVRQHGIVEQCVGLGCRSAKILVFENSRYLAAIQVGSGMEPAPRVDRRNLRNCSKVVRQWVAIRQRGQIFAVPLLDHPEPVKFAVSSVEIAMMIRVARCEPAAADQIADFYAINDVDREGQACRPGPTRGAVLQVKARRRRVIDPGFGTHVVRGADQQVGLLSPHQVNVSHWLTGIGRQGRPPDQTSRAVAEQVERDNAGRIVAARHHVQLVDVAPAVSRAVEIDANATAVDVDDVGSTAAIDIGEPQASGVELVAHIKAAGFTAEAHRDLGAEPAIAEVGPVADLVVADAHQIGHPVAAHVGQEDGLARVREQQPRTFFFIESPADPTGLAETRFGQRWVPDQ